MLMLQEYLNHVKICFSTDYADTKSVKKHNLSVRRMYEIVEKIGNGQTSETVSDFVRLLDITDYKTNVWAAIHLLEHLPVNQQTEERALKIIQQQANGAAADAMGYKIWLEHYNNRGT